MREQHPLDDLFARGLRDAEATPSDAVWEAIVQERGWAHLALLRLRRRWGWLALMLLLGGAAGYWGKGSPGEEHAEVRGTVGMASNAVHPRALVATSTTVATSARFTDPAREHTEQSSPAALATPTPATPSTATPLTDAASITEHRSPRTSPAHKQGPLGYAAQAPPTSAFAIASGIHQTQSSTALPAEEPLSEGPSDAPATGTLTAEMPGPGSAWPTAIERINPSEASGRVLGGIGLLSMRSPWPVRGPLQAVLQDAPPPTFAGPRQAWWVAVTAGQYRETRNWHGREGQLVRALQGTETPHRTTSYGVLAGLVGRKGWGITTGMEYGAAHYDFMHFDQFRSTRDSLVTHVITFNTVVLDSYVDTVATTSEVRRTVAAVNRYTTLRVPLEGSWHRAWRRWHLGLRGGVAVEFNTMRSGVTLMSGEDGTRSVDVSSTEKRKATLVSGGLALDVGYALTERLGLWASPGCATGLFSLSPTDGSPYAVPERLGVRIRLAYTLRPGR